MVYYSCPMIFDRSAIYDIEVDLDPLRLAELNSCPSSYADNDNHFLYFNDTRATPVWCSDPVDGTAIPPSELAMTLTNRLLQLDSAHSAEKLLQLLTNVEAAGLSRETEAFEENATPSILPLVAESLTIVRIGHPDGEE